MCEHKFEFKNLRCNQEILAALHSALTEQNLLLRVPLVV